MRILQVLALLSRSGEYGGPSTVAINQCQALADRGHDVTLVAGSLAAGSTLPISGVEVRTFGILTMGRAPSYTKICSPALMKWVRRHAREFDVVHIHLSRDFVTLPAARLIMLMRVPVFVQTHGMINPRNAIPYKIIDSVLTIPILSGARRAFYLNATELTKLQKANNRTARYAALANGVPTATATVPDEPKQARPEVLFMARLHPRKRVTVFARTAASLAQHFDAQFTIIGPDEGEGAAVDQIFDEARAAHPSIGLRLRRFGPLPVAEVPARLAAASVYVLPSVNEPLPMSVLEAMAAGLPVIVTDTCGFAELVSGADAGIVVNDSVESLTAAISESLLHPKLSRERGLRGLAEVTENWSIAAVALNLEKYYAA